MREEGKRQNILKTDFEKEMLSGELMHGMVSGHIYLTLLQKFIERCIFSTERK